MQKREEPWSEVSQGFEELARAIGLISGYIRVTVTEGKAVKIEAFQYARACCQRRKTNHWEVPTGQCELQMAAAPDFVVEHLEELIVSALGRFGYVEVHLSGGGTTDILFKSGRRNPRPQRTSSRPGVASP